MLDATSSPTPSIVSICGTNRPGNFTSKALAVVNARLNELGIEPTVFDAQQMSLSFPGYPPTDDALSMQEAIRNASGVVLATPEYHGSFCAMTKLIIENMGFPSALAEKPIALLGVAQGRIGAIKSLEQLRGVAAHVGGIALPRAISIAGVQHSFDAEGHCTDAGTEKALHGLADSLLAFLHNYVCPKFALEAMVREDGPAWTVEV